MLNYFPTSGYPQISFIIDLILQLRPTRILDVGVGLGRCGLLCLECLLEALREKQRAIEIDAVEASEPYLSGVYQTAYDRVDTTRWNWLCR